MIEVSNISKFYGSVEVIKNISFSLDKGVILGLLGPNGAGKTTIMRMLCGYHFPCSGDIRVNGFSLEENIIGLKNSIGYLPETPILYMDMTPMEYLMFIAETRHIHTNEKINAINRVLKICGLENRKNTRIETLSRGLKQRVGLAQLLIHDPPVLILDEPFSGLDPNQIMEMRNLIKKLKNKTIIFSTHILQEVESLCTKYLIINKGYIIAQGNMQQETSVKDIEEIFLQLKGNNND